jgi:hypothetical protein
MSEPTMPRARREVRDVPYRLAPLAFGGLSLVLIMSGLLVMWLYPGSMTDRRITNALPHPPSPQLQYDPSLQMTQFSAHETQLLNSAGWVNQSRGIAHIPIGEAMRRIAHDGIPDWPAK